MSIRISFITSWVDLVSGDVGGIGCGNVLSSLPFRCQ